MTMFRHSEIYISLRLEKEPPHRQPAKRLELELSAVLTNRGISAGEASRIAEECARNPTELAERLHRIANEYLHTLALVQRAFAPALPPAIVDAVAAIDGTATLYGGKLTENLIQARTIALMPDPSKFVELFPGAQEYVERCDQLDAGKQCLRCAGHPESHVFTFPALDPPVAL